MEMGRKAQMCPHGISPKSKCKACQNIWKYNWAQTQKGKASRKASLRKYNQSPKGKAAIHRQNVSPKGKARKKRYEQSPKGRRAKKRYQVSPKGQATAHAYYEERKQSP